MIVSSIGRGQYVPDPKGTVRPPSRWDMFTLKIRCIDPRDWSLGRTVVTECAQRMLLLDGRRTRVMVDAWALEDCLREGDDGLDKYARKLLSNVGRTDEESLG